MQPVKLEAIINWYNIEQPWNNILGWLNLKALPYLLGSRVRQTLPKARTMNYGVSIKFSLAVWSQFPTYNLQITPNPTAQIL